MRNTSRREPTENQRKIAAYIAEGRHMLTPERAKTIRQMADEIGINPHTLRHELRRNYYELWAEWWPSYNLFVEQMRAETAALRGSSPPPSVSPIVLPVPDRDAIADEEEAEARYR